MVRVGRALCGSPSPTPCPGRVTQSRLHSTTSRRVWNISREGDSTASPQCPPPLQGDASAVTPRPRPHGEPGWLRAISNTTRPGNAAQASLKTQAAGSGNQLLLKKTYIPPSYAPWVQCLRASGACSQHCTPPGAHPPRGKGGSSQNPIIAPGSALHGRRGGKGQVGPGDLCWGKEAANSPNTQGRERKPQTEISPPTPRKGEAAGGPSELSGSSREARRAPGLRKLTPRGCDAACEH